MLVIVNTKLRYKNKLFTNSKFITKCNLHLKELMANVGAYLQF